MADNNVLNKALIEGVYGDEDLPLSASTELEVLMVQISIVKTADQKVWAQGPLTYIITIANNGDLPYTGLTFTDTLDITKVAFVENSVMIDNVLAPPGGYDYDATTGILTIDLVDIPAGGTRKITFRVTKV